MPYVSLQNGFYAESALLQLRGMQHTGKISLPKDGPVSWQHGLTWRRSRLRCCFNPACWRTEIPPALTGSEMLDFNQIAELASTILGRPIEREVISD